MTAERTDRGDYERKDFARVAWADLHPYVAALAAAERLLRGRARALRDALHEPTSVGLHDGAAESLRELRERIEAGGVDDG